MRTQYYFRSSLDGFHSKPDGLLGLAVPLGDVNKNQLSIFLRWTFGPLRLGSSTYGWIAATQRSNMAQIKANPSAWPYEATHLGVSQAAPCQALRALTSASFTGM